MISIPNYLYRASQAAVLCVGLDSLFHAITAPNHIESTVSALLVVWAALVTYLLYKAGQPAPVPPTPPPAA